MSDRDTIPRAPDGGHPAGDGGFKALWDWRRQVTSLYAGVRDEADGAAAWQSWREKRDRLFRSHPQSPLDARHGFSGLVYFDYDPALRFEVRLSPTEDADVSADGGLDGAVRLHPFARTDGLWEPLGGELTLFWIAGYGGGVLLPFTDATCGRETYGGGRYLLDTMKGADLGGREDALILDFNFAYNPSCCYSPRFVCPLAPRTNALPRPVRGGERAWAP